MSFSSGSDAETPKVKNSLTEAVVEDEDKHISIAAEGETPSKRRKTDPFDNNKLPESNPSITEHASQDSLPTILGQPDFSQTQGSFETDTMAETVGTPVVHESNDNFIEQGGLKSSLRVQKIMEEMANVSTQMTHTQGDAGESPEPMKNDANLSRKDDDVDTADSITIPARVSIGGSPHTSSLECPPCRRWGHTMTSIGQDRVLIYGGQTFDADTNIPTTLNDLYIYNKSTKAWFKPRGVESLPRQWHTCSYIADRQLLITFGGEAFHPKTAKSKTVDQLMVLDCEIMLWYPPAVSGDAPSSRSGHSATLLPHKNQLVVFGGVKGSKWINAVSVLDTTLWKWHTPRVLGSAPKPRSYHSASAVRDNRVVIFGGNDADASFNSVHVLEACADDATQWRWINPTVKGRPPSARTGHSATVLKDNKTICVYGGWDPNADDENVKADQDDESTIFRDCFLLDTETWTWKKCHGKPLYADIPAGVQGLDGGPRRVGHSAILANKNDEVLVFGGRVPRDRFAGDFQTICINE
jgi:hypothetical protein